MASILRGRRIAGVLTCLAAATLILSACDSEDDPDDGVTPTVTSTATAAPTGTATEAATTPATPEPTDAVTAAPEGDATVEVQTEGELAPYLVDAEGMTLYLFMNDEPGVSNCDAGCQANWPLFTVAAEGEITAGEGVTGTLGTLEGGQVTYNDQPLYYFAGDAAPGETNGQGVADIWFVVEP